MNGASTAPRPPLVPTRLQGVAREAATVASNNLMAMMEEKELADRVDLLEKSVSKCKDDIDFREEVTNHLENRLDSLDDRLDIVPRIERLEKAVAALPFGQSKAQVDMLGAPLGNPREDQEVPELHSLAKNVEDTSHEAPGAKNVDFEELREGIDVVEKCFDSQFDKIFEGLMDERERHEKAMKLAESQRDQAKVEREGLRADVDAVKQSLKRLEQHMDEMEHAGLRAQVSSVDQRLKDHYDKEIQTRIPAFERGLESVREGCPGRDSLQNLSSEVRSIKDDVAELSGGLGNLRLNHDILDQRLEARHRNQTRTLEDLQTILSQAKQKHEQDLEAKVKMLQNDISDREQANAKTLENMRQEHASEMAKVREEMASLQKMAAEMAGTQRTMTTEIAALRKEMSANTGKENRHGFGLLELLKQTMVEQNCTQLQQPEQTTEKDSSISSRSAENSPQLPSSPTIYVDLSEESERDMWDVPPTPEPELGVLPAMNLQRRVGGTKTRPPGAATNGSIDSGRSEQFVDYTHSSRAQYRLWRGNPARIRVTSASSRPSSTPSPISRGRSSSKSCCTRRIPALWPGKPAAEAALAARRTPPSAPG